MEKLSYTTLIDAPKEKVWNILWGADTYPQWTAPFAEGSRAETDWQKGSKVLFLDGNGMGMVSRIVENIPNEFMSIQHMGEVKNGKEDTESEQVKQWSGGHENYTLKSNDGKTELTMEMDVTDEFRDMFEKIWPQAIAKLKELSENNQN